jgi:hypothetical protein
MGVFRSSTVRSECLNWLLILNDQHVERVLDVFVEHLQQPPPTPSAGPHAALPGTSDGGACDGVGRGSCHGATASAVWFTSTSWRRDDLSAPYTLDSGKRPETKAKIAEQVHNPVSNRERRIDRRRLFCQSVAPSVKTEG